METRTFSGELPSLFDEEFFNLNDGKIQQIPPKINPSKFDTQKCHFDSNFDKFDPFCSYGEIYVRKSYGCEKRRVPFIIYCCLRKFIYPHFECNHHFWKIQKCTPMLHFPSDYVEGDDEFTFEKDNRNENFAEFSFYFSQMITSVYVEFSIQCSDLMNIIHVSKCKSNHFHVKARTNNLPPYDRAEKLKNFKEDDLIFTSSFITESYLLEPKKYQICINRFSKDYFVRDQNMEAIRTEFFKNLFVLYYNDKSPLVYIID